MTDAISEIEKAIAPATLPSPNMLLDQLLVQAQGNDAGMMLAKSGLSSRLKKQLVECMLDAELKHHLLTQAAQGAAKWGNYRNGSTPKTVFTPSGELELNIPRVRFATFEPRLIPRYQRHLPGFDDNVLSMYAHGIGTSEIQAHLLALYDTQICRDLIATVTDELLAHTRQWQARTLESTYALVYVDTLRLQIRTEDALKNRGVHLVLGVRFDGQREALGLWLEQTDDAAFWGNVVHGLKSRGLANVPIVIADGLLGLQEAITSVYPQAQFKLLSRS